jgi:hypothetical protein
MKYLCTKPALSFSFFIAIFIFINACSKEEDKMIPPILEFKTGAGYTSANAAIGKNAAVKIGIHAEKTEGEDYLKTFSVGHAFDGGAETNDSTLILPESAHDLFETDINIITRDETGMEKYIFTITNRDGLIVSKSITLTVN